MTRRSRRACEVSQRVVRERQLGQCGAARQRGRAQAGQAIPRQHQRIQLRQAPQACAAPRRVTRYMTRALHLTKQSQCIQGRVHLRQAPQACAAPRPVKKCITHGLTKQSRSIQGQQCLVALLACRLAAHQTGAGAMAGKAGGQTAPVTDSSALSFRMSARNDVSPATSKVPESEQKLRLRTCTAAQVGWRVSHCSVTRRDVQGKAHKHMLPTAECKPHCEALDKAPCTQRAQGRPADRRCWDRGGRWRGPPAGCSAQAAPPGP